jgi:HEAT repeat protein
MQSQIVRSGALVACLVVSALTFSVKVEAQSLLREEVSQTVTLVRIGKSSTERTIAAMLLCELTRGDASKQVDDQSLHEIIALLNTSDDSVRYWVALCLANFGPRAKPAVPKLLKILDQTDCVRAAKTSADGIRVALKKIGAEVPTSKCEWRRDEP